MDIKDFVIVTMIFAFTAFIFKDDLVEFCNNIDTSQFISFTLSITNNIVSNMFIFINYIWYNINTIVLYVNTFFTFIIVFVLYHDSHNKE